MNSVDNKPKTLIDTSFLLATMYQKDRNHEIARQAIRESSGERCIVASVLPEVFYMAKERVTYDRAIQQFQLLTSAGFTLIELTSVDHNRMTEIMRQYRDSEFDFVDVSQMAISERLNITRIYTFDRRYFSVFRPKHCESCNSSRKTPLVERVMLCRLK